MLGEPGSIRTRPIPTGLLGMIALVMVIEACLGARGKFADNNAEHWTVKRQEAEREAVRCDLLCLGDSLVEFGVLPKILEERLHQRAYNLALPAGTPAASYFLLRRALDAGARPRALIVDFMPFQLFPVPDLETARRRLWPELASLRDSLDLFLARGNADFVANLWLAQALTSLRERGEIQASIHAALAGKSRLQEESHNFVTRWNLRSNRGSLVMPAYSRAADKVAVVPTLKITERDPVLVAYIDRFFRLARSRGIAVYWIAPPISPEYQAHCDEVGSDASYTAFLHAKQAEFPEVVIIDGRHAGYAPSVFFDGIHLNRRGATALSDDVARVISRSPGLQAVAARWAELPRFRERPDSPIVEDVMDSRVAVGIDPPRGLRR